MYPHTCHISNIAAKDLFHSFKMMFEQVHNEDVLHQWKSYCPQGSGLGVWSVAKVRAKFLRTDAFGGARKSMSLVSIWSDRTSGPLGICVPFGSKTSQRWWWISTAGFWVMLACSAVKARVTSCAQRRSCSCSKKCSLKHSSGKGKSTFWPGQDSTAGGSDMMQCDRNGALPPTFVLEICNAAPGTSKCTMMVRRPLFFWSGPL